MVENKGFDKGYTGAMQGVWLGVVTMTTLGYGDLTPKSHCGKILTAFCVVFGIVMVSMLTGSLVNNINEVDSLSINDQEVVVKANSIEEQVVKDKYNCKTVPKDTYEDVINYIADKNHGSTKGYKLNDMNVRIVVKKL